MTPDRRAEIVKAAAAGGSQTVMGCEDFVALMDADALKGAPRGPYKESTAEIPN